MACAAAGLDPRSGSSSDFLWALGKPVLRFSRWMTNDAIYMLIIPFCNEINALGKIVGVKMTI